MTDDQVCSETSGSEYGATARRLDRRRFLQTAGAAAALTAAAVGTPALVGSLHQRSRPSGALAIAPEDKDALKLLQKMLSFDTQNFGEGGKTLEHAKMLQKVWESAGVDAEIVPTPTEDNVHLIARVKGTSDEPPLLLLGHSDVVPVETDKWTVDPFKGEVRDGLVYGRGALDMKGANSAFVAALLRHLDEGAEFDRDIICLTDADEESGPYGSAWLAEKHWDKIDAGMVLTEGGWFLGQADGSTPMLITVTRQDKLYFNLDIVAGGVATHSSKPNDQTAIVTMSRAMAELGDWLAPAELTDVTREYFEGLASATDDVAFAKAIRLLLKAPSQPLRERAAALVVKRSPYPWLHRALLRTTHAFVIGDSGYKENVIPSEATTRVNCRAVPGGRSAREFLADVRRLLADYDVKVKLVPTEDGQTEEDVLQEIEGASKQPPASLDSPLYEGIESAAGKIYPDAEFAPALFEAGTSLKPWKDKGVPGYGVYPYVLDNEAIIRMHGTDEYIPVEALETGTDFMYEVFARFRTN